MAAPTEGIGSPSLNGGGTAAAVPPNSSRSRSKVVDGEEDIYKRQKPSNGASLCLPDTCNTLIGSKTSTFLRILDYHVIQ